MQPNAAARRGGRRRTRVSVEATRRTVRVLLANGASRDEIIAHLRVKHGIAERTGRTHIGELLDDLARAWEEERPTLRMTLALRLRSLSVAAESRGAFSASIRAEQLFGEVNGILGVRGEAVPRLSPSLAVGEPMTMADAELRIRAAQQALESAKAARERDEQARVEPAAFEMFGDNPE